VPNIFLGSRFGSGGVFKKEILQLWGKMVKREFSLDSFPKPIGKFASVKKKGKTLEVTVQYSASVLNYMDRKGVWHRVINGVHSRCGKGCPFEERGKKS
jgi:hypothetical protein